MSSIKKKEVIDIQFLTFLWSQATRKKKQLKVKLQMARFLQETIEDMAVSSKNPHKKEAVEEFALFFEKVRTGAKINFFKKCCSYVCCKTVFVD